MLRDIEAEAWLLGSGCNLPDWADRHVGKAILRGDGFLTVHTPTGQARLAEGDFLVHIPGQSQLFYMTAEDVKTGLEGREKRPLRPLGSAEDTVN